MTLRRSNKPALWLLAVAFTILAVAILATSAMTAPAEAQDPAGSINNLLVSSPNPGQLLITWDSPAEVPTDYRVRWAPSNQDYLSYSEDNTSERGSAYPKALTLTVDNLPAGIEYKVQVRTRYYEGQHQDNPWSGPWTDEFTQRVNDDPPAAPTGPPRLPSDPRQRDPKLDCPKSWHHHRIQRTAWSRRQLNDRHRGRQWKHQHAVHRLQRGGRDRLRLRRPGPEPRRGRRPFRDNQRHDNRTTATHSGTYAGTGLRRSEQLVAGQRHRWTVGHSVEPPNRRTERLPRRVGSSR